MTTRTVTIHDRCTTPGCNRTLHSIIEGERGTCGPCWIKNMRPERKAAMNALISSAFNGSTETQKKAAVERAFAEMKKDGE